MLSVNWERFVENVQPCSSLAKTSDTIDCLQSSAINKTVLVEGITAAMESAQEYTPFIPVFDGPNGLLTDFPSQLLKNGQFSKLPFIAGTVLDEGLCFSLLYLLSYLACI